MSTGGWTEDLLTGFSDIDAQHTQLFATVARLDEALQRGDATAALSTLVFLEQYALTHFAAEEKRMREAAYPGLAEHVAEHEAFVRDFLRRRASYDADPSLSLLMVELSNWLGSWLHNHVCTLDAEMARYLRGAAKP